MITNQKGLFIALTFALASCTDSNDSDLNNNSGESSLDSIVTISETAAALAVISDRDINCEVHFHTAMNLPKPDRIVIIHCDYWSSNHPNWLEHSFSFELEKDNSFFDELISHNGMVKYENSQAIIAQQKEWFLPNDASNYEGYYAEDDFDDFEIFKDLKSGHLFIRGSQY